MVNFGVVQRSCYLRNMIYAIEVRKIKRFRVVIKSNCRSLRYVAILPLLLLVGGMSVAQEPDARQFDQASFRKLARYLLRPPVKISTPSFTVKDKTLYYFLGDVLLEDAIPTSASTSVPSSLADPISVPLKDQLRIELLRQYLSAPEQGYLAFLEKALKSADDEIAKALAEIKNHVGPRTDLLNKLDTHRVELEKALDNAIRDYAVQQKLNLYKIDRKVLAASVEVKFSSTPSGGVVSYVKEFDWRVATTRNETPPWRVAAQTNTIKLDAGAYRIQVRWPNPQQSGGKDLSEYTIDILSDGQLDIKP